MFYSGCCSAHIGLTILSLIPAEIDSMDASRLTKKALRDQLLQSLVPIFKARLC